MQFQFMRFQFMRSQGSALIRGVVLSAVFAALMAANSAAFASNQDAARFIRHLSHQTIEALRAPELTLDQRKERFRGLLIQGFDIAFIGRFVLGRYWRGATPDQRGAYIALYGEFFLQTYTSRMGDYAGQTIDVIGVRQANAKDFVVRSRIQRPGGQPLTADWRVRVIDGRYRIIDIMVEGISMAITQRSEFASVTQRGGLDGLLSSLRARTAITSETASLN